MRVSCTMIIWIQSLHASYCQSKTITFDLTWLGYLDRSCLVIVRRYNRKCIKRSTSTYTIYRYPSSSSHRGSNIWFSHLFYISLDPWPFLKCEFVFLSLFQVLKKEFPKGVDIVYESVGGEMFDLCLNALAIYGRLVVIGMISQVRGFVFLMCLEFVGLLYLCLSGVITTSSYAVWK